MLLLLFTVTEETLAQEQWWQRVCLEVFFPHWKYNLKKEKLWSAHTSFSAQSWEESVKSFGANRLYKMTKSALMENKPVNSPNSVVSLSSQMFSYTAAEIKNIFGMWGAFK